MRRLLLYIIPFIISACGQSSNESQEQKKAENVEQIKSPEKSSEKETMSFQKINGRAILIGEKVDVLDKNLQTKTTLKESSIVEIVAISDSLFQKTKDYCDAFRYVKIKTESQNGLIDGRNVYKLTDSEQDTSFNYKDNNFHITTTSFFGIGVSDDDGLTFCSKYYEPVVITNNQSNQPRLIKIIENDISKEASWNDDFGYLELMANDGAYDKITKIEQFENGIILTIKREFQEGWNEYEVQLNLSEEHCEAEYLSYGEIKY